MGSAPTTARIDAPRTDAAPTAAARRWALVATALGFGVVQLDVTVVNVAIRPIGTALGGSVSGLQWIVNAYTLGLATLILSAGALGDRVGARRVFVAGFAIFTVASAGCGLAPSLGALVAARAVQGLGAAVLIPCSLSLLTHANPGDAERARAVGIWAACASVALSAGPLVGGALIHVLGWRAIFFINAPLGVLGIALTLRYVAETPRMRRGIDIPGQLLAIVALLALAAATIAGGQQGFTSRSVVAGYVIAAAALAGFVATEARRAAPMLPLRFFRSPTFSAASAIGLTINVVTYGLIFLLSLCFQTVRGYSVLLTGAAFLPMTGAVFAGNLLAGRFASALGARGALAGAGLVVAAAVGSLQLAGTATGYLELVGQLTALGLGLGLLVPTMTSVLLGSVEPTRSGVAAGTLNTARQTGSVVGVALFGALANGHLVTGLHAALGVALGLSLATVGLARVVRPENG